MNYDTMLEGACDVLGIDDYRVISWTPTPEELRHPGLVICKLHGSIPRDGGSVSSSDIRTTMESISQKNLTWLDYMFEQVEKGRRLCFVGYSGRDFDYCQSVIGRLGEDARLPKPYWLMSADSDANSAEAPRCFADRMGAVRIAAYPDSVFPRLLVDVVRTLPPGMGDGLSAAMHAPATSVDKSAMDRLFDRLMLEQRCLTDAQQEFFWTLVLLRTGLNEECQRQLDGLEVAYGRDFEGLPDERMRETLLSAVMTVRRERADFSGYRAAAKRYERCIRKRVRQGRADGALVTLFNAKLQIISSSYMRVPSNLGFRIPLLLRRPFLFVTALFRMVALNARMSRALVARSDDTSLLTLAQEPRIRTLAACCHVSERFRVPKKEWIVRKLRALRDEAEGAGNYITAVGTGKYLNRLGFAASGESVDSQGGMLDLKSELSIVHRDSGEYGKAIGEARRNGNTPDLIKAYFRLARHREDVEGRARPLLEPGELDELDGAIGRVTPAGLRLTLRYLRWRHV